LRLQETILGISDDLDGIGTGSHVSFIRNWLGHEMDGCLTVKFGRYHILLNLNLLIPFEVKVALLQEITNPDGPNGTFFLTLLKACSSNIYLKNV
jgi:hypothetical protein